jgi:hypothetical protein
MTRSVSWRWASRTHGEGAEYVDALLALTEHDPLAAGVADWSAVVVTLVVVLERSVSDHDTRVAFPVRMLRQVAGVGVGIVFG